MNMLFHSTRGQAPDIDLRGVALAGLAPDGGLYLPKSWPRFSASDIAALQGCAYEEVAFRVLRPFMQGIVPEADLQHMIQKSYAGFDVPNVVHMHKLGDERYILELFHGPTLAFKDMALQFLGQLLEYFWAGNDSRLTVIGATSGDTGSAAIAALAHRRNIDLFILYPAKGPSEIQRRQMTCIDVPNVHALAVEGSFDDCQAIVKSLFADAPRRQAWNLTTVNSINLLRILAQIVYYFVAAVAVTPHEPSFVVPTGNFGDIYAGYAAYKCGLPIRNLVVACNRNDILARFFATGHMQAQSVQSTLSPSMDIQISSNFERLLFDLCGQDSEKLRGLMQSPADFRLDRSLWTEAGALFKAGTVSDAETLATMRSVHANDGYVLDPHSAIALKIAGDPSLGLTKPVISLATAHPAKFPETVNKSIGLIPFSLPRIEALIRKPERITLVPAHVQPIVAFIEARKNERSDHHAG